MTKDKVLSCIQPTADMHIGNYFGAIANWVELQDKYDCIYGIVDLHAMTAQYDARILRKNTEQMFLDLIACGIDPERSIIFVQSHVPEHAELCWILNCLCSYGDLTRMTQFKEKSQHLEETSKFISAGLFTYPILQAADILAYRPKFVPVGRDQGQHLELTRTLAQRFNHQFNTEYLPLPKTLYTETPKIMSLADPANKMSKSLGQNHFIGLFETEENVRNAVKPAVTDSGDMMGTGDMSPGVANLFEILKACGKEDFQKSLKKDYDTKQLKYVYLKQAVADSLVELTSELRERRESIKKRHGKIEDLMHDMADKAGAMAKETLSGIREIAGLIPKRN